MPISVYCFLYLSRMFLAHVLRPNSFHRCSNFTPHCRSFTSLPHKRLRKHAHAFHFPACFQVQPTYFHIDGSFSFRSPPPGPQVKPYLRTLPGNFPWTFPAKHCFGAFRGLCWALPVNLGGTFFEPGLGLLQVWSKFFFGTRPEAFCSWGNVLSRDNQIRHR